MSAKQELSNIAFSFSHSVAFEQLSDIVRSCQKINPHEDSTKTDLAGAIYEAFACYFLRFGPLSNLPTNEVFLTPQETLTYYHDYLYPGVKRHDRTFTSTLESVSVPDGLLLEISDDGESSLPIVVYEYTRNIKLSNYIHKYDWFLRNRQNHPHVLGQSRLCFVVPKLSSDTKRNLNDILKKREVDFFEIPVKSSELEILKNDLLT